MTILSELTRDLRYAARTFRREPSFVAGVVLTFALAIGANAAMFTLVERLMLAPPPGIGDADRVVRVELNYTFEGGESYRMSSTSYPAFEAVASLGAAFTSVAAVRSDTMTTGHGAERAEIAAVQASGQYFTVLGVRPALGRFFGPSDDELPEGNTVVVLSHAYWHRRFAGDPAVLGREMIVNDQPFSIVGVAPRGFNGTELSSTDVFVPFTAAMRDQGVGWWSNPGMRLVLVIARLRDGITPSAAGALVTSALREGSTAPANERLGAATLESLVPGKSARESAQARITIWLSGVSLVVLLIATANVGTLLLLRSAKRRREVAVRMALGAGRGRLMRQSLVESLMLALMGAVAGLFLARWFADIVRVSLLPNVAPSDRFIQGIVVMAAVVAACGAGLVAGSSPFVQFRRRNLANDLRTGTGYGASGRFVFQHVLVALQVALCTLLLVGAGLFVRSLQRVQSQDLGFSTARLLYISLDFRGHLAAPERDAVHEEAARRLASLPGVNRVTVVQGMPFSSHHIPPIHISGAVRPFGAGEQIPIMYGATPAYLEMMGVTRREGRLFTERDARGAPLVVLVNESLARTMWPGQSAIGKCIHVGHAGPPGDGDPLAAAASLPCREVVGVVRDSRARSLRVEGNEGRLMQYYVPFDQVPKPPFANVADVHGLLVRTAGEPARLVSAVQRAIQSGSTAPVYARVRPYQELIDPQLRSWRLGATLFPAFGALALGIAAVGLFGVVSYLVTQRTQEIGVRLALGGTTGMVGGLVIRDAVRMAGLGASVGVLIALAGAPLVQSMLFQTSARDPSSVIVAAALLLTVAVGAAALPAWRASRVSPIVALRTDT